MDDTQQIINLLAELGERIGSLTRDLSSRPEVRKAAIAIGGSLFIWTVLRNNQKNVSEECVQETSLPQPAGVATSELVEEIAGIEEDEEDLDGLIDQENKWDQHAAEFCRKENVPNIRSYYKAGSAGNGLFTARREEPVMYKEKTLPKKPIKKTPRRVTPAKATLSTKSKKLTPRSSPRKSVRNPYGDVF